METLNSMKTDLMTDLAAVKKAKLLDDNEVRHTLGNLSWWESSLKEIQQLKGKVDDDAINATVEDAEIVKIKSAFNKLCGVFEAVKTDLITEDKDWVLYSLVKGVKDIAVYPSPFGGTPNKNIYTFKHKMLDALATNQIPARDKVKVLRKYLKGAPRDSIGDHTTVKSVDEAFPILIRAFGNPSETLSSILNDFKKKCTNANGWSVYGTYERHQLSYV